MLVNELMEQKHISKYELSKKSEIPYMTLNDICNDRTRLEKCSAETVYKLAKALGVSMEALLEPRMTERQEFENFLREVAIKVAEEYPQLSKVYLFGSRANGTYTDKSDVDLILEFSESISLITLSGIRLTFIDLLGVDVDVVHGPIPKDSLLVINRKVEIYDRKRQEGSRKNSRGSKNRN